MRETTVKSRDCIDARFWYHESEAVKKVYRLPYRSFFSSHHPPLGANSQAYGWSSYFIFDQALYVRKSLSCPHKWRSTKLPWITFKDHWTKLMRRYGDKTYTIQRGIAIVVNVLLSGDIFRFALFTGLSFPIWKLNTCRHHQLRALINVESSRESSRLFGRRIVPYLLCLTHLRTQSRWLTLLTKGQYKLKIIFYQWC